GSVAARSDVQRSLTAAAEGQVREQILRRITQGRPAEWAPVRGLEIPPTDGLEARMRRVPDSIHHDLEVRRRPLEPSTRRSRRLFVDAPLVALPRPVPGDTATIQVSE